RFDVNGERKPTGTHTFDVACQTHQIEHRLIKPRHPQTNGMVERFNGRIEEILKQTKFAHSKELATTIEHYAKLYNARIPQKMLGHRTPLDTLRAWRKECPDLFVKNIYNLAGPDS
ncbi:MAG TPA: IS481 family transposase, partial [Chlorobaculum parvum]|nr:IS481 family transposase [Chlorobaculum parvum]